MSDTHLAGRAAAKENVASLRRYLEQVEESGEALPRRAGQLNMTAIAKTIGVNRQVLYQNPECVALLDDFEKADRKRHLTALEQAEVQREEKSKTDKDRSALEEKVLRLEAANAELLRNLQVAQAETAALKRRLQQFATVEALMVETGRLP